MNINIKFNTQLNNLKDNLVNTINSSGLPVGIVYYILKDTFNDVAVAYKNTLLEEQTVTNDSNISFGFEEIKEENNNETE